MTNKKNGFLTFLCSMVPGAGEMYLGLMKQGVSTMLLFFFIIALGAWLSMGPLLFLLPIVWCYSFFHVHSLRSMSEEQFAKVEDEYLFYKDDVKIKDFCKKFYKLIAILLILLGVDIIWNNLTDTISRIVPEAYWNLWYNVCDTVGRVIPQLFIAGLIIYAGVYLIKGKKKEIGEEEVCENEE